MNDNEAIAAREAAAAAEEEHDSESPSSLEVFDVWEGDMVEFKGLFKVVPTAIGWQPSIAARQKHHPTYTPKTFAKPASDVMEMQWSQVSQNVAQLKLCLKGGAEYQLSGFPQKSLQVFRDFIRDNLPHVRFTVLGEGPSASRHREPGESFCCDLAASGRARVCTT